MAHRASFDRRLPIGLAVAGTLGVALYLGYKKYRACTQDSEDNKDEGTAEKATSGAPKTETSGQSQKPASGPPAASASPAKPTLAPTSEPPKVVKSEPPKPPPKPQVPPRRESEGTKPESKPVAPPEKKPVPPPLQPVDIKPEVSNPVQSAAPSQDSGVKKAAEVPVKVEPLSPKHIAEMSSTPEVLIEKPKPEVAAPVKSQAEIVLSPPPVASQPEAPKSDPLISLESWDDLSSMPQVSEKEGPAASEPTGSSSASTEIKSDPNSNIVGDQAKPSFPVSDNIESRIPQDLPSPLSLQSWGDLLSSGPQDMISPLRSLESSTCSLDTSPEVDNQHLHGSKASPPTISNGTPSSERLVTSDGTNSRVRRAPNLSPETAKPSTMLEKEAHVLQANDTIEIQYKSTVDETDSKMIHPPKVSKVSSGMSPVTDNKSVDHTKVFIVDQTANTTESRNGTETELKNASDEWESVIQKPTTDFLASRSKIDGNLEAHVDKKLKNTEWRALTIVENQRNDSKEYNVNDTRHVENTNISVTDLQVNSAVSEEAAEAECKNTIAGTGVCPAKDSEQIDHKKVHIVDQKFNTAQVGDGNTAESQKWTSGERDLEMHVPSKKSGGMSEETKSKHIDHTKVGAFDEKVKTTEFGNDAVAEHTMITDKDGIILGDKPMTEKNGSVSPSTDNTRIGESIHESAGLNLVDDHFPSNGTNSDILQKYGQTGAEHNREKLPSNSPVDSLNGIDVKDRELPTAEQNDEQSQSIISTNSDDIDKSYFLVCAQQGSQTKESEIALRQDKNYNSQTVIERSESVNSVDSLENGGNGVNDAAKKRYQAFKSGISLDNQSSARLESFGSADSLETDSDLQESHKKGQGSVFQSGSAVESDLPSAGERNRTVSKSDSSSVKSSTNSLDSLEDSEKRTRSYADALKVGMESTGALRPSSAQGLTNLKPLNEQLGVMAPSDSRDSLESPSSDLNLSMSSLLSSPETTHYWSADKATGEPLWAARSLSRNSESFSSIDSLELRQRGESVSSTENTPAATPHIDGVFSSETSGHSAGVETSRDEEPKPIVISLRWRSKPDDSRREVAIQKEIVDLGMQVVSTTAEDGKYVHQVFNIRRSGPAYRMSLRNEDILMRMNGMPVGRWSHDVLLEQIRLLNESEFTMTVQRRVNNGMILKNLQTRVRKTKRGIAVAGEVSDVAESQLPKVMDILVASSAGLDNPCQCFVSSADASRFLCLRGHRLRMLPKKDDNSFLFSRHLFNCTSHSPTSPSSKPSTSRFVAVVSGWINTTTAGYVTVVGRNQLSIMKHSRVSGGPSELTRPDARFFYHHHTSEYDCFESTQLPYHFIASDGEKVFLKMVISPKEIETDPELRFKIKYVG